MVYIYRSLLIYKNQSALVITLFIIICCDLLLAFSLYFHSTVFDLLYKCNIFLTEYLTLAVSISDAPIQQTCNKKQCDMSQMQQQLEAENLLSNQSIHQLVATS